MPRKESIDRVLAGRKAVDAYRLSHQENPSVDRSEQLLKSIRTLGFSSVDEFFAFNRRVNLGIWAECVAFEGFCDECEGRQQGCLPKCHADTADLAEEGRRQGKPVGRGDGAILFGSINLYREHWQSHLPLHLGDRIPLVPNCSIILRVVKEPEVDCQWR